MVVLPRYWSLGCNVRGCFPVISLVWIILLGRVDQNTKSIHGTKINYKELVQQEAVFVKTALWQNLMAIVSYWGTNTKRTPGHLQLSEEFGCLQCKDFGSADDPSGQVNTQKFAKLHNVPFQWELAAYNGSFIHTFARTPTTFSWNPDLDWK